MTLPLNSRLSALYDTNGTQKDFGFGFRVFFDPDNGGYGLEVRRQIAGGYEIIPKSDYLVLPVEDNSSGVVRFNVAPSAGQQIYIAGKTPTIQQLVLTNFGRYSAESIETQFDFITAIIQEWISGLDEETRQRIENDQLLKQHIEQRINDFIAEVDSRFEGKWLEISEYLDTMLPMFFNIMREEIEAFTNEQLPAIINQRLLEVINAEMDAYLDDLSHQVSQNIEAINEAAANATVAESAKNEAIVAKNQIVSEIGETKNYFDEALSQLSTAASKYYSTLSEANYYITYMGVNELVYVGGYDGAEGLYYKASPEATNLTKSNYDPLTQAKADATNKANAAKSEAINAAVAYTDEKINEIDLGAPVLTGREIYDKSLINDAKLFTAIWSEYNKPVWHIGNRVFVDAVGAKIKPVVEELVFTLKAEQVNQTFYFPTSLQDGESFTVDWGDGSTQVVSGVRRRHDYICEIGDEFVVKATGAVVSFVFGNPVGDINSNTMLKSIDKNTLPKVTRTFDLRGCINLTSVCSGAFSSYSGTALNFGLASNCPSLVLNKDMFLGLSQVVNIDNLFAATSRDINQTIPEGVLDPFVNVTSAQYLFTRLTSNVPDGILDKLTNLENVYRMFYYATPTSSINPNLFKNQAKLKNVGGCFQSCKAVSDAEILYTDMVRGNPTTTESCFRLATNMTNLAAVPTGWK